jgi:S1-C subfamily serine protease
MAQYIRNLAFKVINSLTNSTVGLAIFLALVVAPLIGFYLAVNNVPPASFTVSITNLEENSGGSGSIIYTSKTLSKVLTNAHVCDVLNVKGGLVRKEDGTKFLARGYIKSAYHDLCVISVAGDLGQTLKLASSAPGLYSEALITGHPALLPVQLMGGRFGDRKIIQIVSGTVPCTDEDFKNPEIAQYCMFIGAKPIFKTFESQVVSAMIMAGSSGSAVLNTKGELSGVVFAGNSGGLSYAFCVPYAYVAYFLDTELKTNTTEVSPWHEAKKELTVSESTIKTKCAEAGITPALKEFCDQVSNNMIWVEE